MINMVNYKIKKDKLNKKRRIIVIAFGILVVLAVVLAIILWPEKPVENKEPVDKQPVVLRNVSGKLAKYITNLGEEYYIKYTGKYGKKNLNTTLVDATIEFTRKKEKTAIYSEDVNMHVVIDGEDSTNMLHKQKMILKSKLPVRFSTEPYNLISDFGQIYVKDQETTIDGVKYIYQEYKYQNSIIRYYFIEDELSYIRIIANNEDRKINIRIEKKSKDELFKIPTNYKEYNV